MKILNVNMSLDPVTGGGTVERTLQLSHEMARMGIKTVILTADIGLTQRQKKNNENFEVVALPCLCRRFYFPKFSLRAIKKIIAETDIVHLMGHWTFINALVYHLARKVKKPYVVCPAGALPIYGRSQVVKKFYNFIIGKEIIRNANACIAIAVNEETHFKSYGVGIDKISFIPNGIDCNEFNVRGGNGFRKKHNLGDHPFILFVGRLNSIKGPDLLLRSFCKAQEGLKGYHLVFAGPDGGMLAELKNMTAQFSSQDRVHFVGYITGEDKAAAYKEAELLVIPSRQEAMSIVVLEAGICGKPVLITDQCGFNDIAVVNGGIVVPALVESIKQGLLEILGDQERGRSMGSNLKKYVEDNFTWKIAVEKYLRLYRMILERGK